MIKPKYTFSMELLDGGKLTFKFLSREVFTAVSEKVVRRGLSRFVGEFQGKVEWQDGSLSADLHIKHNFFNCEEVYTEFDTYFKGLGHSVSLKSNTDSKRGYNL